MFEYHANPLIPKRQFYLRMLRFFYLFNHHIRRFPGDRDVRLLVFCPTQLGGCLLQCVDDSDGNGAN